MQTFLTTLKYNKFYIYKTPINQHQRFCNAFRYYFIVNAKNPVYPKLSLCTEFPIQGFLQTFHSRPGSSQSSESTKSQVSQKPIEETIIADVNPPPNAAAQKKAAEIINATNMKLAELQQIYNFTSDYEIWCNLMEPGYQCNNREKKAKLLQERQEVIQYSSPGHPSLLTQYFDLHEHIHECIEFRAADKKRRKEIIKVRTICHLQEELKSKTHHHPANIAVASISRDEKNEHPDEHYCLASVKGAKQFAALFPTHSVIISQDDKAKDPLGIPAVRRTFKTIQSF
ncbi:unnamed protein product [Rhizophagus irregularis]|nr:unnamed protein product [Rhizophagus irregularis]